MYKNENNTDEDIYRIVVYCSISETWYAEIYDQTNDVTLFGASPDECPCLDMVNDRFDEVTGDICCRGSIVYGGFELDGLDSCAGRKVTINVGLDV